MNVVLEPVEGAEVETYVVRMVEDDGQGKLLAIGIAKRTGPEEWSFRPMEDKEAAHTMGTRADDVVSLTLHAKDRDELAQVLRTRFGAVEIPADRLRINTMEQFTDGLLHPLNILAARTGSMPGFAAGLARSLARMIAEDIKPGTEDVFRSQFMAHVDAQVVALREMNRLRDNVNEMLGSMFKTRGDAGDDDEGPTKH